MANVTELSPAAQARRSTSRTRENRDDLEAQISRLQDDIKSIAATLTRLTEKRANEVKSEAEAGVSSLVHQGRQVVDNMGDQANAIEAQLKRTVREKPLTAVLGAAGIGFLIALLSRR